MSPVQKKLQLFVTTIGRISEYIGKTMSFLILPLIFVIMFEVISRYFFNRPTTWAADVSVYLAGPLAILAGAWVTSRETHIVVDIFYKNFSPRKKAIVDLFTSPFLFIMCGILIWIGVEEAWESLKIKETAESAWAPPIYPLKMVIPIAGLLMTIQGIALFIRNLTRALGRGDIS